MNMDTREGASLLREEQLFVVHVAREVVPGRRPVQSALIASSTADAKGFARELVAAGLAIFLPVPVFLLNPIETEMLVGFHKAVADAVDMSSVAEHAGLFGHAALRVAGERGFQGSGLK